jgi:hypothetical protein
LKERGTAACEMRWSSHQVTWLASEPVAGASTAAKSALSAGTAVRIYGVFPSV